MGIKAWMAACAAAMVCASAGEAGATIYTLTFDGTVGAGYVGLGNPTPYHFTGTDGDGAFGPAGTSLVGDAFHATVTLDTSLGNLIESNRSIFDYGGLGFGNASPIVSADLTINGRTLSFGTVPYARVDATLSLEGEEYGVLSGGGPLSLIWLSYETGAFTETPYDPFGPLSVNGDGYFSTADGATSALLIANSASVSPDLPGSIPEPATWAMMLLGVGMLGAAARSGRRRNEAALAA